MLCMEHIVTRVASALNMDPTEVRKINMLKAGDILPFDKINKEGDRHVIETPYNLTEMTQLSLEGYSVKGSEAC